MSKELRPYQQLAIDRVRDSTTLGVSSGIINLATGLGKSFTTVKMTEQLFDPQDQRTMFFAPSVDLVWQMASNYKNDFPALSMGYSNRQGFHPGIGVVMQRRNDSDARVIVASVASVVDRSVSDEDERDNFPIVASDVKADRFGNIHKALGSKRKFLVSERFDNILANGGLINNYVYDEAHHSVATESLRMFKRIQELHDILNVPFRLVGLTATPIRWDGVAMGNLYDKIHIRRGFRWAQHMGYLVPFAPSLTVELEYDRATTDKGVKSASNWKDMVIDTYHEVAQERQVIVFTSPIGELTGVEVAKELAKEFVNRGIKASAVDGQSVITPDGQEHSGTKLRGNIYESFMRRDIKILCMYGVGLEGLDLPAADCLFWMRKTDNAVLMTQAVGRILRLHPGKEDALVVDFTGMGMDVSPMATLLGQMVDPDMEAEDEQAEIEDELTNPTEGATIFDGLTNHKSLVTAKGRTVKVSSVIRSQGDDWHYDHESDSLSLALSESHALIIKNPNFALKQRADEALQVIHLQMVGDDVDFSEERLSNIAKKFEGKPTEVLERWEKALEWLVRYASKYTLWHVYKPEGKSYYKLANESFIDVDEDIQELLVKASIYSSTEIQDRADFLADKKKRWSGKVSQAQRNFLKNLGYSQWDDPDIRKKEASKIITHILAHQKIEQGFVGDMKKRLSALEK